MLHDRDFKSERLLVVRSSPGLQAIMDDRKGKYEISVFQNRWVSIKSESSVLRMEQVKIERRML